MVTSSLSLTMAAASLVSKSSVAVSAPESPAHPTTDFSNAARLPSPSPCFLPPVTPAVTGTSRRAFVRLSCPFIPPSNEHPPASATSHA